MGALSEYRDFFAEFRRTFHTTGAVAPSGWPLARALARTISGPHAPMRILEVGPGTGSVTCAIIRNMRAGDTLDAVEINPAFSAIVERRLREDPMMRPRAAQVRVITSPIQDVEGDGVYDAVVSGLPLNNFSPELIRSIFAAMTRLAKPGAVLSYFEYALIRGIKSVFVGKAERVRLAGVSAVVGEYVKKYQLGWEFVPVNLPPAVVRRLVLRPA